MYFARINSNNIDPLIKEFLNVNKKMHDEGKYSWHTCVNNMFKEFDLDIRSLVYYIRIILNFRLVMKFIFRL
jgi:hypothetical protein